MQIGILGKKERKKERIRRVCSVQEEKSLSSQRFCFHGQLVWLRLIRMYTCCLFICLFLS